MTSDLILNWRPLDADQAPAWASLMEAIEQADQQGQHFGAQDLLEDIDFPGCDFPRGTIAAYQGDEMVGYVILRIRAAATPVHNLVADANVHPAYRGRGIGGQLITWAERAAWPLHEERFAGHPLALLWDCDNRNADGIALFEGRGYRQTRWFHLMCAQLTSALPDVVVPDAIQIAQFTAGRSADALLVRNEAFRDHWGSTESTEETWAHHVTAPPFRPGMTFLAYDGGEPLGLILCQEFEAETMATGERDLYVQTVGTRRAGRNRGIASALLATALRAAAVDGFGTASLNVDADSPSGAVGLYERAGFGIRTTAVTMCKQLAATPSVA